MGSTAVPLQVLARPVRLYLRRHPALPKAYCLPRLHSLNREGLGGGSKTVAYARALATAK